MDRIIWSSETLRRIASLLRDASDEMDAETTRLRHCRNEIPQALRDQDGALLDGILGQTERAVRNLTEASERAAELSRAVQIADALFEETELEIRRLYETIEVSAEPAEPDIPSAHWEGPAHIAVVQGLTGRAAAVPEWLSAAAEQFFRGASPDVPTAK
ncbi:MAG: hypothetical protein K2O18_10225 [Oscillospiraceae bacterium]|nr:hypothetical protein [Oscillospiraceae bacterium]